MKVLFQEKARVSRARGWLVGILKRDREPRKNDQELSRSKKKLNMAKDPYIGGEKVVCARESYTGISEDMLRGEVNGRW